MEQEAELNAEKAVNVDLQRGFENTPDPEEGRSVAQPHGVWGRGTVSPCGHFGGLPV